MDLYSITKRILLLGLSIIFNFAESIIPNVPSAPIIILWASLFDLILSILYPEEFLDVFGILSLSILIISKIFFPTIFIFGNLFYFHSINNIISDTLSIVLPYFKLRTSTWIIS